MPMWTEPRRRTRVGGSASTARRGRRTSARATRSRRFGSGEREVAGADPGRSLADSVDAGRAEAVEGDTRHGGAPARDEGGRAGEVGALLVDLGRAAQRHVVDALRVDPGAFDEGPLEVHDEVDGGEAVQRPARGPAPAGGADDIEDVRVVAVVHASSVRSCRSSRDLPLLVARPGPAAAASHPASHSASCSTVPGEGQGWAPTAASGAEADMTGGSSSTSPTGVWVLGGSQTDFAAPPDP